MLRNQQLFTNSSKPTHYARTVRDATKSDSVMLNSCCPLRKCRKDCRPADMVTIAGRLPEPTPHGVKISLAADAEAPGVGPPEMT